MYILHPSMSPTVSSAFQCQGSGHDSRRTFQAYISHSSMSPTVSSAAPVTLLANTSIRMTPKLKMSTCAAKAQESTAYKRVSKCS